MTFPWPHTPLLKAGAVGAGLLGEVPGPRRPSQASVSPTAAHYQTVPFIMLGPAACKGVFM